MAEIGIIAALAEALPKLEGAKKNVTNPHFKAKYADLGNVIAALEPIKAHGLWFIQISKERDNGACFETFVIHGPSGEKLSMGDTFVPADRSNAQGFGSAMSYARRYGLMSAFGLAAEDDDGNAAASAPPKAEVISDGQWMEVVDLIDKTNTDAGAFCKAFKIASVKELPTAQFERAKTMLHKKLADMGEGV